MDRPWRRSALLLIGLVIAVGVPAAIAWPSLAATSPRTLSVSTSGTLASALASAQPGDRIIVADGVYGTALKMTRSGTPTAPITIAARDPGQAQLTSPDAIRFGAVSHVIVQGFTFSGNASVLETYISYLRHKVDAFDPPLIHTIRGVGYSLRLPR